MNKLLYLILTCFCCTIYPLYAQEEPSKFGKISKDELEMQIYTPDSTAAAVVLCDIGSTRFKYNQSSGIQLEFRRRTRIKILKNEGYTWADAQIPLYKSGKNKEVISTLKGYTYNLIDGKVEKEKLKKDGEFTEAYNDNLDLYKFTMPAVKTGSVIEYEYVIVSDFLYNFQDWHFQSSIPVIWSEYNVAIPEYFKYQQFTRGYYPLSIHETGSRSGSFNFTTKNRVENNRTVKTDYSNHNLKFIEFTERFVAKDVPALVEEPYITTMEDYVMKISFELASISIPGQATEIYATTWENIDKDLLKAEHFGQIIQKKGALKKQAEALVGTETDPAKKLAILYSYMRDHVSWNGNERLYANQSAIRTLEEKSGNAADINLTLIAMLRAVGLEANPVALSTRSHGMMIPSYPMLNQYNYVIAHVQVDNNELLLDATEPNCPHNLLPVRCLNNQGRLIAEDGKARWINLDKQKKSPSQKMVVAYASFNEEQQLDIKLSLGSYGYEALNLRKNYYQKVEERQKALEEKNSHWQVKNYSSSQWSDIYEPVKEELELSSKDIVQTGKLIYINPMIADRISENPFKLNERTYPVDYAHPNAKMYMLNLQLPEGYEVEELPEAISVVLPENSAHFTYQAKQMGNIIQLVSKLEINKSRFLAQEYTHLREFYNIIVSKQAEQLVLRKTIKSE
ncbi:transglutaminase domain-containing protein [Porifericola rhodea]|uniref:DUF3857 domain-containing protein n=1 Tax=Porifericola rhodea TaxID=930972 RepID=UPI002666D290|nr:transglutaminase domain-containing protein [Porifericola rhodea]WKN30373.1 transglutaminase domain-containing protein [Porifericola rhodea]